MCETPQAPKGPSLVNVTEMYACFCVVCYSPMEDGRQETVRCSLPLPDSCRSLNCFCYVGKFLVMWRVLNGREGGGLDMIYDIYRTTVGGESASTRPSYDDTRYRYRYCYSTGIILIL
jgi:hypothetical protein